MVAEREHCVPAAHRRAAQDAGDRLVTKSCQQSLGLLLPAKREGTVMVRAGPSLLAASMGVADEVHHGGLPGAWGASLGTVADPPDQPSTSVVGQPSPRVHPALADPAATAATIGPAINGGAVATGERRE